MTLRNTPAHLSLFTVFLDKRGRVLHLKDGVLAEVDKAFHLLLVAAVADGGVEEGLLRLLDLRLLPLVQLVLVDLEVNSLNLAGDHFMREIELKGGVLLSLQF